MQRSHIFGLGRVNLIKKVKVDGAWKFCPAVVEPGKKLNDLVRVSGQVQTHSEGTYYLEWREQGRRRRQPVRNRAIVFEQARLKGLKLEGQHKNFEPDSTSELAIAAPAGTRSFPQPIVLENGVSIRTVQEWLGHSDLESTMIYLKYVRRKDIQQLVDSSELAALAAHCALAGKLAEPKPSQSFVAPPLSSNLIEFKRDAGPTRV
jgi:hypothetical protein